MSYRSMTKEERKKHIRRKFRTNREKIYVFASVVIILIVLVTVFVYSLQQNYDPVLPILIFAGIVVAGMIGIFFIDLFSWESE